MTEYLRLVKERKVVLAPLIEATYPIAQAPVAYERLKTEEKKPLMVLLTYPNETPDLSHSRIVVNPIAQPAGKEQIRMAIAGAGGFAKAMHLPNLKSLSELYRVHGIMSAPVIMPSPRPGSLARNIQRPTMRQCSKTLKSRRF